MDYAPPILFSMDTVNVETIVIGESGIVVQTHGNTRKVNYART